MCIVLGFHRVCLGCLFLRPGGRLAEDWIVSRTPERLRYRLLVLGHSVVSSSCGLPTNGKRYVEGKEGLKDAK